MTDHVGFGSHAVDTEVEGALARWSQKEEMVGETRCNHKLRHLEERERDIFW